MSAVSIDQPTLPMIDRAAIHIGTTLVAWGRRRAERASENSGAEIYRSDYAERVRNASAVARQRLLP